MRTTLAKYYVVSGDMQTILNSDSSHQAALDAFKIMIDRGHGSGVSWLVKVSEFGFESVNGDDILFLTDQLISDANLDDAFYKPPVEH